MICRIHPARPLAEPPSTRPFASQSPRPELGQPPLRNHTDRPRSAVAGGNARGRTAVREVGGAVQDPHHRGQAHPERAWLADVSAVVLQQSLRDLDTALKNFFDSLKGKRPKTGPPRYKSKKDSRQSIRLNNNAFSLQENGAVYVAKVGNLKVEWSRTLPAAPTSLTVVKDSAGRYFLSFVVDTGPEYLSEVDADTGADLGLGHFAVLAGGTKVDSPRFLRRAEKKLTRMQKSLSRKAEGSGNRARARAEVARRHAKVADRRRDWLHKLSTDLIRDNQAIYVEGLAAKGLARTRLAKSVHDAGWSMFVAMLEYKALKCGRYFGRIGRFEPTSQVCSACGSRAAPSPSESENGPARSVGPSTIAM